MTDSGGRPSPGGEGRRPLFERRLHGGENSLESGYQRLEDGSLFVANLTMMPGWKEYMVEWWLGYLQTDEHYRRWHPKDHVSLEWDENWRPGHHVGATHYVHEYMGGELRKLKIRFLDPPGLAPTRQRRIELLPDQVGEHLLEHRVEEMRILAAFLPDLYARETGER